MKLVFLGRFRDLVSPDIHERALPPNIRNLSELKRWLARAEPGLGHALENTRMRIAVNQTIARNLRQSICEGDEIAFLPPMSGG